MRRAPGEGHQPTSRSERTPKPPRGRSTLPLPGSRSRPQLAEAARLVLRIDSELHVPGPGEDVGGVLIDAKDWDTLLRLAREGLGEGDVR